MEREKYRGNHRGYFSNSHAGAARRGLELARAFYSTPNNVGYINLGFVWEQKLKPK